MSGRDTQRPPISDVRLERYRLGELPEAEREAIDLRLRGDEALRERLSRLDRSDAEIVERHPASEMVDAIRRRVAVLDLEDRASARRRGRAAWLTPAAVAATACLCLVVVAASLWDRLPLREHTTIKSGDPSLVIHRRVGAGSEELSGGAMARQGDALRIGYRAAGYAYGAIVSIDGRGNLTPHLPRTGNRSATLQPSGTVFLDFAYELDDAPRWEAFYFVTSDAPFDIETVRQAISRAAVPEQASPAALRLPRGLAQFLFVVIKDDR
jgi:hypothetical protein